MIRRPALLTLVFLLAPGACAPAIVPCAGTTCPGSDECLANRCVPRGNDPVPAGTERWVLEPLEFAVSGFRAANATMAALGRSSAGNATLYLRFSTAWKRRGAVSAAFLVLSPSSGTEPDQKDVPVEVRPIDGAWSLPGVASGARPPLAKARASGIARGSPPTLIRVDVTSIVRKLSGTPWDDGLAVSAASASGRGVAVSTGAGGGDAPRLELYLGRNSTARR